MANEECVEQQRGPWWRVNASMITITAVCVVAALLVPEVWLERLRGFFPESAARRDTIQRPFQADLASVDVALRGGSSGGVSREVLVAWRVPLMIRRLAEVGPLAGDHIVGLSVMLEELDAHPDRVEPERHGFWREERVRRLAAEYPRWSAARLRAALDSFEEDYERALSAARDQQR